MNRVLITGASGFVGRNALPLLVACGFDVHALSRSGPAFAVPGVHWHAADMLDPASSADLMRELRVSHWLHLAWVTAPDKYRSSIENVRWVEASLRMLRAFREHGGERVVMAGTCAEYGSQRDLCREQDTPAAPQTLYGSCKHALQLLLHAFCLETRLNGAWGRVFHLYGPGEHPCRLFPMVIGALLKAQPARCTHGGQIRDFLHVADAAAAFVAILTSPHTGPINISSGQAVSVRDIVNNIAAQLDRRELVRFNTVTAPEGDSRVLVGDNSLLRDLGWRPKFDLTGGIADTIEWWRNETHY